MRKTEEATRTRLSWIRNSRISFVSTDPPVVLDTEEEEEAREETDDEGSLEDDDDEEEELEDTKRAEEELAIECNAPGVRPTEESVDSCCFPAFATDERMSLRRALLLPLLDTIFATAAVADGITFIETEVSTTLFLA